MTRKLTPPERGNLKMQHRHERDGRVRDRIKAVLAYDDGYSYTEVAKILLLDDESVRRHIEDYFQKQKLKPQNGGSTTNLNEEETKQLIAHLKEKTYLYVKDICAYITKQFNKEYSISGLTKWLHEHKFCYKKPHPVPAKANAEAQAVFIGEYEALKPSVNEGEPLYFMDSCHPEHQTRLAYGWIQKGVRKAEKRTARQKRINMIGAVNLAGHHIEYRQVEWVNKETLQAFFEQLIAANPLAKTIHIVLDNAGYHKNRELLSFVEKTNIVLHYLPPYSPNLNPIERLWKIMHEQTTYNRYYPKFADFTEAILKFFQNLSEYKTMIQSRLNDNFQKLSLSP